MKIAIIEDEKNNVLLLKSLLEEVVFEYEIVGDAPSVSDAVQLIENMKPDLVLQDIKIKGGTGFDVIEQFPRREFELVFITAYSEFAIKAIRTSAVDYLLKPIDTDEFLATMNKVYKIFTDKHS